MTLFLFDKFESDVDQSNLGRPYVFLQDMKSLLVVTLFYIPTRCGSTVVYGPATLIHYYVAGPFFGLFCMMFLEELQDDKHANKKNKGPKTPIILMILQP